MTMGVSCDVALHKKLHDPSDCICYENYYGKKTGGIAVSMSIYVSKIAPPKKIYFHNGVVFGGATPGHFIVEILPLIVLYWDHNVSIGTRT